MRYLLIGIFVIFLIAAHQSSAADTIFCKGVGICWGTDSDDTMIGDYGTNEIRGLGGNDALNGFGFGDFLHGGAGRDQLAGGTGNDVMRGNGGNDYIIGGCFAPACAPGRNKAYGGDGADTVGLDNGVSYEVARGGNGRDTFYGDPYDDWAGFEKVIINGVCKKGC